MSTPALRANRVSGIPATRLFDHSPFQDAERAHARRVHQGLRLTDAAAGPDGLGIAEVGTRAPDPPSLLDQLVDALATEPVRLVRLEVGRRELVDGHLGGDVLGPEARHRVTPAAVGHV